MNRVTWCSGPRGASWLEIDSQLAALVHAQHPELRIEVVPGGGRENLDALRRGDCQLATSIDFLGAAAYAGHEPFGPDGFRALRTLHAGWSIIPFHLVHVRGRAAELGAVLHSSGSRIGVPPRSTSDELTFRHALSYYDTSYEQLESAGVTVVHRDYVELVDALTGGEIDYLFGATAAPATILSTLDTTGDRGFTLAPLAPGLRDHLTRRGYRHAVIPSTTYPALQSADVRTSAMAGALYASDRLADETARKIMSSFLGHIDEVRAIHPSLTNVSAAPEAGSLVPLHPGAR